MSSLILGLPALLLGEGTPRNIGELGDSPGWQFRTADYAEKDQ